MALLDRHDRRGLRDRGARIATAVALLGLVGCILMETVEAEDPGPKFSHQLHVEELGVGCVDCHEEVEGLDRPGLPNQLFCQFCHDDIDTEKEPEQRASVFFADGEFLPSQTRKKQSPEIIFSHASHLRYVDDCSTCHRGITDSDQIVDVPIVGMNDCMGCHARNDIDRGCETCHREIDVDVPPDDHAQMWMELHGQAFRNKTGGLSDDCSLCHSDTTCVTCHQDELPANHTNFWRLRTHGLDASFDRRRCQTCHRDDFCNRCHQEAEPLSHKGMWGQTKNTHCLSCHFPLQNESCFVCHKSTPSHNQATPLPQDPNHNPVLDCRQCHGNGAPLPHVDDGSSCIACHQ